MLLLAPSPFAASIHPMEHPIPRLVKERKSAFFLCCTAAEEDIKAASSLISSQRLFTQQQEKKDRGNAKKINDRPLPVV